MKNLLTGIFLIAGLAGTANAAIECDAYAGLNRYHYSVQLNNAEPGGLMRVTTDDGFVYAGNSTYYKNGRTGDETFYLPVGRTSGIEILVENGGTERVWLCLQENSCYDCR